MWESLQNLIPAAAKQRNFAVGMQAITVCREYRSIAKRILPEQVQQNTDAKSYKEKILTLTAASPAHAQEINFKSHLIQEELNQSHGEDTVLKIKVEITE